jgi:hypothetical protein
LVERQTRLVCINHDATGGPWFNPSHVHFSFTTLAP